MKEYEFNCLKCGSKWYECKRDIKESKRLEREIRYIKFKMHFTLQTNKSRRRLAEQLAQIRLGQRDYLRCPTCGSRHIKQI